MRAWSADGSMLSQVRYLPSQVCEVMTLPSVLAERPTMMLVQLCCQPSISSEGVCANADRVYNVRSETGQKNLGVLHNKIVKGKYFLK